MLRLHFKTRDILLSGPPPHLSEGVWMLRAIYMSFCTKTHFSAAPNVLFCFVDHFTGLYMGKCWSSLACTPKQSWREGYQVMCEKEEINNCFIATNGFHTPSAFVNINDVSPEHPGAVTLLRPAASSGCLNTVRKGTRRFQPAVLRLCAGTSSEGRNELHNNLLFSKFLLFPS